MTFNDVRISSGSQQSDWTSAKSVCHRRYSAVRRKTALYCFVASIFFAISKVDILNIPIFVCQRKKEKKEKKKQNLRTFCSAKASLKKSDYNQYICI